MDPDAYPPFTHAWGDAPAQSFTDLNDDEATVACDAISASGWPAPLRKPAGPIDMAESVPVPARRAGSQEGELANQDGERVVVGPDSARLKTVVVGRPLVGGVESLPRGIPRKKFFGAPSNGQDGRSAFKQIANAV